MQVGNHSYQENKIVQTLTPTVDAALLLSSDADLANSLVDLACDGTGRDTVGRFREAVGRCLVSELTDASSLTDGRGVSEVPPGVGRRLRVRHMQVVSIGHDTKINNEHNIHATIGRRVDHSVRKGFPLGAPATSLGVGSRTTDARSRRTAGPPHARCRARCEPTAKESQSSYRDRRNRRGLSREVSDSRVGDINTDGWTWKVRRQTTPSPGGLAGKGTKGKRARDVPLIVELRCPPQPSSRERVARIPAHRLRRMRDTPLHSPVDAERSFTFRTGILKLPVNRTQEPRRGLVKQTSS